MNLNERLELTPSIDDLGYASVNMTYAAFCAAIDEPDGDYARDKYAHFKALGKAFNLLGWSEATLNRVVSAYVASQAQCTCNFFEPGARRAGNPDLCRCGHGPSRHVASSGACQA